MQTVLEVHSSPDLGVSTSARRRKAEKINSILTDRAFLQARIYGCSLLGSVLLRLRSRAVRSLYQQLYDLECLSLHSSSGLDQMATLVAGRMPCGDQGLVIA
eukprot:3463583-Amphidinium_carterae.2